MPIFKLDDVPIQRIEWVTSDYIIEPYNHIEVGEDGITEINAHTQYLGESQICWLQVWKGDDLVARFNAENIKVIYYKI